MRRAIGLLLLCALVALVTGCFEITPRTASVAIMTWNVRGYPEDPGAESQYLSHILTTYAPDILCVQEIANDSAVAAFIATETGYAGVAFLNSSDGQDNAVFFRHGVAFTDLPDPGGFQHPAQLASVSISGLGAQVLTVHLSFSDDAKRAQERQTLVSWALPLLATGTDIIIAGDFNTKGGSGDTIDELAQALGMEVLEVGSGVATTCGGSSYDFILISPGIVSAWQATTQVLAPSPDDRTVACGVSDHFPAFAVLVQEGQRPGCTGR